MSSSAPKILLTGATGYIGGTVLAQLLASEHPLLKGTVVTALLRDADGSRGAILTKAYGNRVAPVHFDDQDDSAHVEQIAAEHDIAINTTMGFHLTFGAAVVRGLARGKRQQDGRAPLMIHTSGTTNVADRPLTGTKYPDREFDDAKGAATYEWEVKANSEEPYAQRTAELAVVDAGLETGVKTLVIMSPTIYGIGNGQFNQRSMQIPRFTRLVLERGEAAVFGDGAGIWDNVHVMDLADLYVLIVTKYLDQDPGLPTGREGIIFSGSRRHSWKEVAQSIADAAHAKGKIASSQVKEIPVDQIEHPEKVELGLASTSKTVSSVAHRLGWKPKHGDDSWKRGFDEELEEALKTS